MVDYNAPNDKASLKTYLSGKKVSLEMLLRMSEELDLTTVSQFRGLVHNMIEAIDSLEG